MKTKLTTISFIILLILCSCKKNRPDANTTNGVTNLMDDGTWHITEFIEDGDNETNHFSGFNFEFNKDNKLVAENGSTTFTGTWSISDSDSDDDALSNLHFNINFASPDEFEDLSDDWDILEKDSDHIRLKDVSGGNGGTDYLTFVRN